MLLAIFSTGYKTGVWRANTSSDIEIGDLKQIFRTRLNEKDSTTGELRVEISKLEKSVLELERGREESSRKLTDFAEETATIINQANDRANSYRAKAEFLKRYISYLEQPSPNGTMYKLFVDHVCVLWQQTQRDIFQTSSVGLSFADISRGIALSPPSLESLEEAGITENMLKEYQLLKNNVSRVSPRVGPSSSTNQDSQRFQSLENRLQNSVEKAPETKTLTFFDDDRYVIPLPVAQAVHFRNDCKP